MLRVPSLARSLVGTAQHKLGAVTRPPTIPIPLFVVGLLLALAIFGAGLSWCARSLGIVRGWTPIDARVTDFSRSGNATGQRSIRYTVEIPLEDGTVSLANVSVTGGPYPRVGGMLEVFSNPDDPTDAIADRWKELWMVQLIVTAIGLVAGTILTGSFFTLRSPKYRARMAPYYAAAAEAEAKVAP